MDLSTREDRLLGLLLGTAIGDALGLPFEGMSAAKARRAFRSRAPHYIGWGRAAVSDDTEQAALLAQALATNQRSTTKPSFVTKQGPTKQGGAAGCARPVLPAQGLTTSESAKPAEDAKEHGAVVRSFRRSLIAWFLRLPFGIGFGTLRACGRLCVGLRGSSSAGNGAMMRAPILGTLPETSRRELGREIAELTHSDPRAVEAALFTADVSAACLSHGPASARVRRGMVVHAAASIESAEIRAAVERGLAAAEYSPDACSPDERSPDEPWPNELPNSGFAPHSVALCVAVFVRDGTTCLSAVASCIRAGGDTDTHAAIVGAWCGALYGARSIDEAHIALLQRGPFGRRHLRDLAAALVHRSPAPRWSPLGALLRNLSLYPLVLAHGITRVVRW